MSDDVYVVYKCVTISYVTGHFRIRRDQTNDEPLTLINVSGRLRFKNLDELVRKCSEEEILATKEGTKQKLTMSPLKGTAAGRCLCCTKVPSFEKSR